MGRASQEKLARRVARLERREPQSEDKGSPLVHIATVVGSVLAVLGFFVEQAWAFYLLVPSAYLSLVCAFAETSLIRSVLLKWLARISVVAVISLFSVQVVFVSAPIEVRAFVRDGTYETGALVAGIEWRREYSDFRLTLRNDSTYDFDDVDVEFVVPKASVVKMGQDGASPQVSFINTNPVASVTTKGADGIIRPLQQLGDTNAPQRFTISRLYRGGSFVQVVAALVDLSPVVDAIKKSGQKLNKLDGNATEVPVSGNVTIDSMYGPRPLPTSVTIKMRYRAAFRTREFVKVIQVTKS